MYKKNHNFFLNLIKLSKKNKKSKHRNKSKRKNKNNMKINEKFTNQLLNIYDEPLKACGNETMTNGSWDSEGKCSELGGGVHQICINNISKNAPYFSKKTGQSPWSNSRGKNNHCVCLGAWSLYNAKLQQNNLAPNILKCDAIPKASLSNNYVNKFSEGWNKWNGYEYDNQIINGVESLVNKCYNPNNKKSHKLRKNYCNFAKNVPSLKNSSSNLYNQLCS